MNKIVVAGIVFVVLAGCREQTAAPVVATMPSAQQTAGKQELRGTVAESMDAAGFTYVRLATKNGDEWVVLSPVKVTKGEELIVETGLVTEKFESKSLNRSFEKVTFARLVSGGTPLAPQGGSPDHATAMNGAMPAGHPAVADMAAQHASAANGPAEAAAVKVPKAEGPGAHTVQELWAGRDDLGDTNVVVRGKVVKALSGIMGKNWLHLRDGSGSRAAGDDDITVTTNDTAKVGDVVVVSGTLRVDKDFGAGYKYAVLIEDGKVK